MTWRPAVAGLSHRLGEQLRALMDQLAEGAITLDDFAALSGPLVAAANTLAARAALMDTVRKIVDLGGLPEAGPDLTASLNRAGESERLSAALRVIAAERMAGVLPALAEHLTGRDRETFIADYGRMRLERLAASEPAEAAQRASKAAISDNEIKWYRGLSAGACRLCQDWAEGGRTFHPRARLKRHNGCTCEAVPVAGPW